MEQITDKPELAITTSNTNTFKLGISIAQISVMVIVLSILKQVLYYKNFNVPIESFLDLSGLGLIISADIVTLFPFVLFVALFLSLLFAWARSHEKKQLVLNKENNKKPAQISQKFLIGLLVLSMAIPAILGIVKTSNFYYMAVKNIGSIFIYGSLILVAVFTLFYKDKSMSLAVTLSTLSFFIGIFFFKLGTDIAHAEIGSYKGTEIYVGDKPPLISNDSTFYIGKTDKYIFIYDKHSKSTTVLPSETITKIVLKKDW